MEKNIIGTDTMKKIIIFGEEAVGKTSIVMTSCYGYDFDAIQKLKPTKGISIEPINHRGIEAIHIWDCAGQERYMQKYLSNVGKIRIFSSIDAAVFVMDASRPKTLNPNYVNIFLNILLEFNPELEKVYLFINKMDIAPPNINELLMQLTNQVLSSWHNGLVEIVSCSVKFGSAQEKFVHILDMLVQNDNQLMEKQSFFAECLEDFREVVDGDFALFHIPSGLLIANLLSDRNADMDVFAYGYEIMNSILHKGREENEMDEYIHQRNDLIYIYLRINHHSALMSVISSTIEKDTDEIITELKGCATFSDLRDIL